MNDVILCYIAFEIRKVSEITRNYYEKSKEKTVELWYDGVKIGGVCPVIIIAVYE